MISNVIVLYLNAYTNPHLELLLYCVCYTGKHIGGGGGGGGSQRTGCGGNGPLCSPHCVTSPHLGPPTHILQEIGKVIKPKDI